MNKAKIKRFLKENEGVYTLKQVATMFGVSVEDVKEIAKSMWGIKEKKTEISADVLEMRVNLKYKLLAEINKTGKEKYGFVKFLA